MNQARSEEEEKGTDNNMIQDGSYKKKVVETKKLILGNISFVIKPVKEKSIKKAIKNLNFQKKLSSCYILDKKT